MNSTEKSPKVLVCVNRRFGFDTPSCAMRGSDKILKALKAELRQRESTIAVEEFLCLGQCQKGPALRLAPGGAFYLGAKTDQVSEIADWVVKEATELSAK